MLRRSSSLVLFVSVAAAQEAAVDFVRDIAPILQNRCVSCHGPDKQKGDLRLDRKEHVFVAGEEELWSVVPGKPEDSTLIQRIGLPAGDEDVMPNEGDPLRPDQIELLRRWVAGGAEWPAAGDEYFAGIAAAQKVVRIDFGIEAPDAATQAAVSRALQALEARGVTARVVAADTPAVDVNASLLGKEFTDADLELLVDLAPVLVWLNLSRTAVSDAGLQVVAKLPQLRRLNLSRTAIGDVGLAHLVSLPRLEVLNIYGTPVTDLGLGAAAGIGSLRKVYAFESTVTAAGVAALPAREPALVVDRGEYVSSRMAAAAAEVAARQAASQPVNATCPVTGKPVAADQTVEHEGLRIAFCCGKCKKAFVDEPAKYAAQVAEYKKKD